MKNLAIDPGGRGHPMKTAKIRYQCRHIFTEGRRCKTP
jgi:hypothetical protein